MKVKEAAIVKRVTRELRAAGWLVYKIHGGPYQIAGLPDLLAISPEGRHVWIECKRPGGKLTALQAARHDELRKNNAVVLVVDGPIQVVKLAEAAV